MSNFQVAPNVYQITERRANIFLLVSRRLTLIDTGFSSSLPAIKEFIGRLGRSIEEIDLIVLTHNHPDHTGGVRELKKLAHFKIAAPKRDFDLEDNAFAYPGGKLLEILMNSQIFSGIRRRILLDESTIDMWLEDNQILPVDGGLQVIYTPGHTAGSISLYAMNEKILFVGDALNKRYGLPLRTISVNNKKAAESVVHMAKLEVETLCFGHGKPIKAGAQIYLRNLAERTKRKYRIEE